ncbi:MAG: diguanylate cyclase domain-containing protein, partial [Aquabacterium sp.]
PLHASGLFSSLSVRRHDDTYRDLVMDRAGLLLAHTDAGRVLGRAADEPGLASVLAHWRDAGSPIDTHGSARVVDEHLVSMAGIPGQDWVLVRLTPQSVAMAPVASARAAALPVAAAVGLAVAVLSGLLAWAVTRPISALRSRAEALLDGAAPDQRPWPQGQGEIGDLSRAFQHVVQQARQREARIEGLVQELEAVLDHAGVGIAVSRNSRYELVSRHFCEMFRCRREEALGQLTRGFYASDAVYQEMADRARPALTLHGAFDGEAELARRDGQHFWAHLRACAVVPGDPSKGTIWIIEDVTEARAQRERLAHSAHHDVLTGLPNRAAFEQTLGRATAQAAQAPFCALFIDLDRFKQVNDTGGHAAGDALLRGIAKALKGALRRSDTVARLGGDEFAVVLEGCPLERGKAIAEKLRLAVSAYQLDWNGKVHTVGSSLGLVQVDGRYTSMAEVLADADAACYAAKRGGRDQVAVFQRSEAAGETDTTPDVPAPPPVDLPSPAGA